MGGLVARNFSTSGATGYTYKNTRSRYQGTFRDIVTLDTPETGSELAYYLDYVFANSTEHFNGLVPSAVWLPACGLLPSTTLRDCMASIFFGGAKLPLSYTGHDLTEGAVYSLIPDAMIPLLPQSEQTGLRFCDLPNPNIPNAAWFAVASSWKDDNHLPASTIRFFWDNLIAATYPPSQNPMTLTDMLGTPYNDVIVRLDSQLNGAIPGQFRVFQDLSHTNLPLLGPGLVALSYDPATQYFSNNYVTNDASVNQQVGTWLGYVSSIQLPQVSHARTQASTSPALTSTLATQSSLHEKTIFCSRRKIDSHGAGSFCRGRSAYTDPP